MYLNAKKIFIFLFVLGLVIGLPLCIKLKIFIFFLSDQPRDLGFQLFCASLRNGLILFLSANSEMRQAKTNLLALNLLLQLYLTLKGQISFRVKLLLEDRPTTHYPDLSINPASHNLA